MELYELGGNQCSEDIFINAYLPANKFDGLIICFDLNNLKSLENAKLYLNQLPKFINPTETKQA